MLFQYWAFSDLFEHIKFIIKLYIPIHSDYYFSNGERYKMSKASQCPVSDHL